MIDEIENLVAEHGEVHAVVSEHDREFEFRQGTTTFQEDSVVVFENDKTHIINADEIIRVYNPVEALH